MTLIRPLEAADIPAVAGLFQRIFRDARQPTPEALAVYLRRLYLEFPGRDPEINPLVHLKDDGGISGFIGVTPLRMTFEGKPLRAAICGSLMVENHESDPMAGARLLKAFLAGPQDISLSETASEVSAAMWTRLRGVQLSQYSLDWIRVIRPVSFFTHLISAKARAARMFSPLAGRIDQTLRGRMEADALHWSGLSDKWKRAGGYGTVQITRDEFAGLIAPLTAHFPLRPDWASDQLEQILLDAERKEEYGPATFCRVETKTGKPVGAFLYHSTPGAIGRVLQVLALSGHTGAVIDSMLSYAAEQELAGLRGRTQPALLEAMLGRRIAFTHLASTVVHARDPEIVRAFEDGKAFLNGIAGEHWSRLIGSRFE
ncbi:hypothetical protein DUT91_15355 [Phyllobacterium salinisoli]|uniref:GNAT family N-acetyltransferase n=1 Tax=Phyllobacterium salinisoli TaxID=1899321 RepID=A0A368K0F6_9HYPH|nr:hypothetical protein [Phyllobacterium salinisoli]RCS22869.1 hypothetical protein DUT91_15355 [Phyllobacterium salinisoli]